MPLSLDRDRKFQYRLRYINRRQTVPMYDLVYVNLQMPNHTQEFGRGVRWVCLHRLLAPILEEVP